MGTPLVVIPASSFYICMPIYIMDLLIFNEYSETADVE